MNKSKLFKGLIVTAATLGTTYVVARKVAKSKSEKKRNELNKDNPYLERPIEKHNTYELTVKKHNTYELTVKDGIDKILAFGGLVLLSPVYLAVSAAIYIDDPGPVLFTQKRVGKNKEFFELHKFRSMKMSTPHDMPTHMLENPEQYITRVGKFIRKYSIDELPQIWDIFSGDMAVIGPRPALWNQDDLVEERDKYDANDVKPGLTGLAQISGRDELEIPIKARIDGDYVKALKKSSFSGIKADFKCFFGTITSVLKHDGVVEGGTGDMKKSSKYKWEYVDVDRMGILLEDEYQVKHHNGQTRILFLSNHFITLYSFRKELITRLAQEGYDIYISTPEDPDNKFFEDLGCKVITTYMDRRGVNPKNDFRTILEYRKIMKQVNPDIIFSYTIKPNIYGSLVSNLLGYKQVCNITGTGATFLNDNGVSKIAKMMYRMTIKKCYKVFFQNTGDRDFFIENDMIGNNYDMLPGSGVNLEQYHLTPFPDDEVIRFIFIGRVMKLKGIDQYLEAADIIHERYPNTEFLIAGWNEEKEYIEKVQQYVNKGAVNYIGFQDNIGEWIEKCQCTILPSHGGEGVPNVLLESAASGRVCIASSINGSKDVIDDGITGFIFEKENAADLIDKIERFLILSNSERAKMGLAGRHKVETEFNREIVVKKYIDEINKASK